MRLTLQFQQLSLYGIDDFHQTGFLRVLVVRLHFVCMSRACVLFKCIYYKVEFEHRWSLWIVELKTATVLFWYFFFVYLSHFARSLPLKNFFSWVCKSRVRYYEWWWKERRVLPFCLILYIKLIEDTHTRTRWIKKTASRLLVSLNKFAEIRLCFDVRGTLFCKQHKIHWWWFLL